MPFDGSSSREHRANLRARSISRAAAGPVASSQARLLAAHGQRFFHGRIVGCAGHGGLQVDDGCLPLFLLFVDRSSYGAEMRIVRRQRIAWVKSSIASRGC